MPKYKIIWCDGSELDFESELFLPETIEINGVDVAFFNDANVGLNIDEIKESFIDGAAYKFSRYIS